MASAAATDLPIVIIILIIISLSNLVTNRLGYEWGSDTQLTRDINPCIASLILQTDWLISVTWQNAITSPPITTSFWSSDFQDVDITDDVVIITE